MYTGVPPWCPEYCEDGVLLYVVPEAVVLLTLSVVDPEKPCRFNSEGWVALPNSGGEEMQCAKNCSQPFLLKVHLEPKWHQSMHDVASA
mgnify:CR=1 FL=1